MKTFGRYLLINVKFLLLLHIPQSPSEHEAGLAWRCFLLDNGNLCYQTPQIHFRLPFFWPTSCSYSKDTNQNMVGFSPCLTAWPNKVSVTCSVIRLTALCLGWAFPRYGRNVTKEPGGLRCFCRPLHGQCMDLYPQILHGIWVPWSCPDFSVSCTWHIHTRWPFVPQVCLVLSHLAVYTAFNWCYALYTRYKNCSCHLSSLSIQLEITLLCVSHSLSQECVNNGLSLKEKETFSLLF